MATRQDLEVRAANVNVIAANYPNDSRLEQAVIYAENQVAATSTATKLNVASTPNKVARHGGANV